jgi:hypothetical protein
MTEQKWPEWIDDLVSQVRLGSEATFWETADRLVTEGLPAQSGRYLAVVGLAELASWSHKIDRDGAEPCVGRALAFERFLPGQDPRENPGEGS